MIKAVKRLGFTYQNYSPFWDVDFHAIDKSEENSWFILKTLFNDMS